MAKRLPYTYCAKVSLMRRDTSETQEVQMSNTIFAEDADEAKDIALVECADSAAKNFPAWKVMRFDVWRIRIASDAAWA